MFCHLLNVALINRLSVAAPAMTTDGPTHLDIVNPFIRRANLTSSVDAALVKRELPPRDEMLYVAWDSELLPPPPGGAPNIALLDHPPFSISTYLC